jgi:hypothetical protein
MGIASRTALALACAVGGVLVGAGAPEEVPPEPAKFAQPVRVKAGDAWLGAGRLYPSPVLHDVDGDGLQDVVVGDLFGKVTFARRVPDEGGAVVFAAEAPLPNRRAEQLKFHNW